MRYYSFNRENILKNAWNKYQYKGGKAAKYYAANQKVLREDARNKYRNLSNYRNLRKIKKEISKGKIPHEY